MIRKFVVDYIKQRRCTLLGVGPMSRNCVDVAIDLANKHKIPLMLIASRRQIECGAMGGGYVEKWSTEAFADYVRSRDSGRHVLLARDHGGPWQHPLENKMNLASAMKSARDSYSVDIESGMQIIHIDPSVDPSGPPSNEELVNRVLELYQHCWEVAQRNRRDIAFEVGTEEQGTTLHAAEDFSRVLTQIKEGCRRLGLPQPLFIVGQTGTKVMERRNIGNFESFTKGRSPTEVKTLLEICARHEILLKEHNTDYLSDEALALHGQIGIHSANVAPEFGVVESLALLNLAESTGFQRIAERFLEISFASRKWEKWMLPNTKATDRDRAIIAGHYVFAKPEFHELKNEFAHALKGRGINLDAHLKREISDSILRYLSYFEMIEAPMAVAA